MNKSELRKIYLEKRKLLSKDECEKKSVQIAEGFFQKFDLSKTKIIHTFLTIEKFNEVDTKHIIRRIREKFPNVEITVPRVDFQKKEIENLKFTDEKRIVQNSWGINEPSHGEFVETKKIDLVIVPLLCFDKKGFRVGYGGGFYDKFLKNCRADCLKIGLSFFSPIAEIEGIQRYDIKLNHCVTPKKIFVFG